MLQTLPSTATQRPPDGHVTATQRLLAAFSQGCISPTCNDDTPGGICLSAEITTCALVAATPGARAECCFHPKIYVALEGRMPAGTFYTFSLEPQLKCQAGAAPRQTLHT